MKRSTVKLLFWVAAVVVIAGALDPEARAVARRKLSRKELLALARDVGFPDPKFAADIAMRESGGDPMALNRNPPIEVSIGLWQINTLVHHKYSLEDLTDPRRNAEYAYEISKRGTDWSPWSTAGKQLSSAPMTPDGFRP